MDGNNAALFENHRLHFSSRQAKNPASKSAKRLIESQELAHTRQAATKKYQHAVKQRSEALRKNALDKADTGALDDPNVSRGYDLWNIHDEKKGEKKNDQSNFFELLLQ